MLRVAAEIPREVGILLGVVCGHVLWYHPVRFPEVDGVAEETTTALLIATRPYQAHARKPRVLRDQLQQGSDHDGKLVSRPVRSY